MGSPTRSGTAPGTGTAGEPVLLRFPDRSSASHEPNRAASSPVWIRGYRGKRTCDLIVGGILAVATAPAIVGIASLLALTGRGQVFESESMLGGGGKPFRRLRFRTRPASRLSQEEVNEDQEFLPLFRGVRRPRTRFGRFLHATRLERLPELWSVLRGDLSLVGPAPQCETAQTGGALSEDSRWNLKPGVVWPAGDSADSTAVDYVARQSVLTDLRIVVTGLWRLAAAAFREAMREPLAAPGRSCRGVRTSPSDREQDPPDEK